MEMVGEFNQAEFTWTNDECFAPLPFSPDGTAKRRRHSTVHVHARQLALPVFLCGKGSKGGAVTAVFWVLQVSLYARRGGGRPNSLRRARAI